jgi:hypothetical protein
MLLYRNRILKISKNIIKIKVVILSILIAFYSRTGRTKKIAELISNSLNCDYEEIVYTDSFLFQNWKN